MSGLTRRLIKFLAVFVIALAALLLLWEAAAPVYTAAVGTLARPGLRLLEPHQVTVLAAQGDQLWAYRLVGGQEVAPFTFYDRYAFFAVLPLIALVVATPSLRLVRRLASVLLAIAGQLVVHAALVVASIELAYVGMGLTAVGPATAGVLGSVQIVVRLLWDACPLAIWAALTAGPWVRLLRSLHDRGPARANARGAGTPGVCEGRRAQYREGRTT